MKDLLMENLTADLITTDPMKQLDSVRHLFRLLAENAPQPCPGHGAHTSHSTGGSGATM
jgi:hypothetical protein